MFVDRDCNTYMLLTIKYYQTYVAGPHYYYCKKSLSAQVHFITSNFLYLHSQR